ncbi:cyclin-dependent kinase [Anaeramoeba flamelloides]|uniref:Cyclin-dependent kinase 8 n=1 Tax=Anaeramoeba flamelloides TaxID=1746091 RepID=A0AAV8AAM6_9EUKA|nr:cyclin-dependent kinase [Anaeramoeba flamelloides]
MNKDIFLIYEFLGVIAEGSYGIVHKARHRKTKQNVAIKEYKNRSTSNEGMMISTIREIKLLTDLNHETIVKIKDIFITENDQKMQSKMFIVFEYAEFELSTLIQYHKKQQTRMPPKLIKNLIYQILLAINYLHQNWVIHRDIKPANILIKHTNEEKGIVKITDFGLSRIFKDPFRPLGHDGDVVTLWYRAPELLLGSNHYTKAIDMWSVGCLFAELITGNPLFRGKEIKQRNTFQNDQMGQIIKILGKPTPLKWKDVTKLQFYPEINKLKSKKNTLSQHVKLAKSDLAYQLMSKMLLYDPKERITFQQALNHPYFSELSNLQNNIMPAFKEDAPEYPSRKLLSYSKKYHSNPSFKIKMHPNKKNSIRPSKNNNKTNNTFLVNKRFIKGKSLNVNQDFSRKRKNSISENKFNKKLENSISPSNNKKKRTNEKKKN